MSALSQWSDALAPFFEAGRNAKPDVKRLSALLRSAEPLPPGFRTLLAEILDSRLPGALSCNWQLEPAWLGGYDREAKISKDEAEVARKIQEAQAGGSTLTDALQSRTDWTIWQRIKLKQAQRLKLAASMNKASVAVRRFATRIVERD